MTLPTDKLNEHIDQLVIWLRDNQGAKMLASQKIRLTNILNAIVNSATFSEEELQKLKTEIPKPKTSTNYISLSPGYVRCEDCGDKLNVKNIAKHKNKCRAKNKTHKKSFSNSNKQTTRKPKNGIYTGNLISMNEKKNKS